MAETMGQIIRRLRKEQNLTQEELAEQLNISAPAISKWENDTGMPDISQVVPLANLFGVPTDVLFGVFGADHKEDIDNRLGEIYRMSDACKDGEEGETAVIILDKYRELMRFYPNNPTILKEAMAFAEMVISGNEKELREVIGQDGIDSLTGEIIRWAGLVIKYSTKITDILSAKTRLINIYVRKMDWNSAYEIVDTFPREISDTRRIRLADIKLRAGETADEKTARSENIRELADQLAHQSYTLGNLYMRQGKYEDALYCYSFVRDMLDCMYRGEKYRPPFMYDAIPLYRSPAFCLMKLGREDEAVALLETGVEFIKTQAKYFNKKKTLDIPLFEDYEFSYGFDGDAECGDVDSKIKTLVCCDELKPLADNQRYRALVDSITE